jgi:hypothetical protein
MKRATEVGGLISQHIDDLHQIVPNTWKRRTMYAVARCRTAAMGGHIDQCNNPECRKVHISYNSCRNRHCPKCQGHLREQWIQAREADLLNTKYFHVVFTLPHHLNEQALEKPELIYQLLFKTAWGLIRDFGYNPKLLGAKMGMIAVLHTWGQNMSLHPHLHCIIPAGGITKSNKWKASGAKGKYLFPVKEMKRVFRARYVAALRNEITLDKNLVLSCFSFYKLDFFLQNGSRKLFAWFWMCGESCNQAMCFHFRTYNYIQIGLLGFRSSPSWYKRNYFR